METALEARHTAILLIDCPDRKGLVAAIADFLYTHGANILHADQHQDNELGLFFMRVEWSLEDFDLTREVFRERFEPIAARFQMNWRVEYSDLLPRMALFVSREQHCLLDLLHRWRIGEQQCEIPLIVSNHEDARQLAEFYGVPFHHVPVASGDRERPEFRSLRSRGFESATSTARCYRALVAGIARESGGPQRIPRRPSGGCAPSPRANLKPDGRLEGYDGGGASMTGLNSRITVEPGKMGGKPCIRGLRFTVYDLASYLASGMTEDEILKDFPYLEKEDFQAVYEFFASIPERIAILEASR